MKNLLIWLTLFGVPLVFADIEFNLNDAELDGKKFRLSSCNFAIKRGACYLKFKKIDNELKAFGINWEGDFAHGKGIKLGYDRGELILEHPSCKYRAIRSKEDGSIYQLYASRSRRLHNHIICPESMWLEDSSTVDKTSTKLEKYVNIERSFYNFFFNSASEMGTYFFHDNDGRLKVIILDDRNFIFGADRYTYYLEKDIQGNFSTKLHSSCFGCGLREYAGLVQKVSNLDIDQDGVVDYRVKVARKFGVKKELVFYRVIRQH